MTNEQARKVRTTLNTTLERIRNNTDLSRAARIKQIANAYDTAKQAITTLEAAAAAEARTRHTALERGLFGITDPSDASYAMSYRDAYNHVAGIDVNDERKAVDLMARAETTGDVALAKAALAVAYERGWVDVINTYANAHEELDQDINDLWDLRTGRGEDAFTFDYSIPDKPAELRIFSDHQVTGFANGSIEPDVQVEANSWG